MVLQAVEVSQITKTFLNYFVPFDQLNLLHSEVKFDCCKMILFKFNFPVQISGVQMVLKEIGILTTI